MNGQQHQRAKAKRTVTALLLPISKKRNGKCIQCGACCKSPDPCAFLRYKPDGSRYCEIYRIRPLNCRKYPRTEDESFTSDTCGFWFE